MTTARLTHDQREILLTLAKYKQPPSARQIMDNLDRPVYRRGYWSGDQVDASLRRMAGRGLIEHDHGRPHRWVLTDAGRAAIA